MVHAPAPAPKQPVVALTRPRLQRCGDRQCPPLACSHRHNDRVGKPRSPSAAPEIVHAVLRSSGESLDGSLLVGMERKFEHDFSRVRIHTDSQAARSAESVGARAYTVGPHVVFGAGQYAPGTTAGARLIVHELTHVVQQARLGGPAPTELALAHRSDPAEQEAEHIADDAISDGRAHVEVSRHGPLADRLHRQVEGSPPADSASAETGETAERDSSQLQSGLAKCGCTPCPTSPCTTVRPGNTSIIDAFQLAQKWLDSATGRLDDFIAGVSSSLVKKALDRHFGASTIADATSVHDKLMDLHTPPVTTAPINGNCQPTCPAPGRHVHASSPVAWSGTNCYEFCDPFFKAPPKLRTHIVIHEMAHSWLSCGDHTYEGDSGYPGGMAMDNADSYAALTRDLR